MRECGKNLADTRHNNKICSFDSSNCCALLVVFEARRMTVGVNLRNELVDFVVDEAGRIPQGVNNFGQARERVVGVVGFAILRVDFRHNATNGIINRSYSRAVRSSDPSDSAKMITCVSRKT